MSNPLTRFSDFVNATETIKTMASMTIKELCQSVTSENGEESGGSGEEADNH